MNDYILHSDYAEIICNYGKNNKALVKIDLDKIDICKQFHWYVTKRNGYNYVYSHETGKNPLMLARFLTNANPGMQVEYGNKDSLDCRLQNLSIITCSQKRFRDKIRSSNSTGVIGVSFEQSTQRYKAYIKGKTIGRFDTLEEARTAREQRESEFITKFTPIR